MIIWIDGVNGVGKSSVSASLEEQLNDRNAEYIESDLYWLDMLKTKFYMAFLGMEPSNHKYFLKILKKIIEEKMDVHDKLPIVSFALVNPLCESELINYFKEKNSPMVHIILEASKATIFERIENDPIRDEAAQRDQKEKVEEQMRYLKENYPDAIKINTENKSIEDIVDEIVNKLNFELLNEKYKFEI